MGNSGTMPRRARSGRTGSDVVAFNEQLAGSALTIREILADGNCLFSSVADQIERDPSLHAKYRGEVVQHLEENADDFMPFITTTKAGFQKYCDKMRREGAWGGQLELVAA